MDVERKYAHEATAEKKKRCESRHIATKEQTTVSPYKTRHKASRRNYDKVRRVNAVIKKESAENTRKSFQAIRELVCQTFIDTTER